MFVEEDISVHSTVAGSVASGIHGNRSSPSLGRGSSGKLSSIRRSFSRLSIPKNLSKLSLRSGNSNHSIGSQDEQFPHMSSSPGVRTPSSEKSSPRMHRMRSFRSTQDSRSNSNGDLSNSVRSTSSVDSGGPTTIPSFSKENAKGRHHGHAQRFISYGVSQAVGRKDQDRFDVRLANEHASGEVHYFGVFDGHGTSSLAADLCVDRLFEDVLRASKRPASIDSDDTDSVDSGEDVTMFSNSSHEHESMEALPEDEAIIRGHLKVDELVQANRHTDPRAGTCTVTLMVEQPDGRATQTAGGPVPPLNCKASWCGDCRAIMITGKGDLHQLTVDHRIDVNESEHERILNADHTPRPGLLESELWRREKEKAAGSDSRRLRAHSFVDRRTFNGKPAGPRCVFSHTGGVSLQVTRSIGDAYAARSVIARPDVCTFQVPGNEYARFVLASDGVFEAMDDLEVAKFVSRISNPTKAAQKLSAQAKQKRLYSGMGVDDITCIVVDINHEKRPSKAVKLSGVVTPVYESVFDNANELMMM